MSAERLGLVGALAVLQVADIITTRAVLRDGGVEVNPFMKPFADEWWQMASVKGLVLGLYVAVSYEDDFPYIGWLVSLFAAVVAWNLTQI